MWTLVLLLNVQDGIPPTAVETETPCFTVYSLSQHTRALICVTDIRPHRILFSSGLYYLQIQKHEQKPQIIKQIGCSSAT